MDLEEQEQLAALKAWWKENGTLVVAVVLAASVAFAGWTGWNRYKSGQAAEASVLYEALTKAVQAGDDKAVREAGGTLVESYSGTHYAALGALLAARHYFDQGDLKNARAQLQWVIEEAPSDDLRDIARL
ncbi:MAG TPA: tetratricopeptide repeat protein, partial [Burkholderiales bacterium]|nr:tetratricopeptide repeat protein [Burkholderiales bacterium]